MHSHKLLLQGRSLLQQPSPNASRCVHPLASLEAEMMPERSHKEHEVDLLQRELNAYPAHGLSNAWIQTCGSRRRGRLVATPSRYPTIGMLATAQHDAAHKAVLCCGSVVTGSRLQLPPSRCPSSRGSSTDMQHYTHSVPRDQGRRASTFSDPSWIRVAAKERGVASRGECHLVPRQKAGHGIQSTSDHISSVSRRGACTLAIPGQTHPEA